jgi:hypothetical protein
VAEKSREGGLGFAIFLDAIEEESNGKVYMQYIIRGGDGDANSRRLADLDIQYFRDHGAALSFG